MKPWTWVMNSWKMSPTSASQAVVLRGLPLADRRRCIRLIFGGKRAMAAGQILILPSKARLYRSGERLGKPRD